MNIKLYILHSDTPQHGIHVQVFTTLKACNKELIRIMREEPISDDKTRKQIEDFIAARKIGRAWELWRNNAPDDAYYSRFESEIEIPRKPWPQCPEFIVNKIDDEYDLGWDTTTNISILTSFIQNHCDPADFKRHVTRIAEQDLKELT